MRIGNRLMLNVVLISLFSVIVTSTIIGIISYSQGREIIKSEIQDQLIALRESKKDEIERYFSTIRRQALMMASDMVIISAMNDFKQSFINYKDELDKTKKTNYNMAIIQKYMQEFNDEYNIANGQLKIDSKKLFNLSRESSFALQYNYILQNPYPIGSKDDLGYVEDGTSYSSYHKQYHQQFQNYSKELGFYDIFLIDLQTGDVIYSVFKELDFATSLNNGVFAGSGLAAVFNKAKAANVANFTAISDFQPYAPSYDGEAAFIAVPIYKEGKKIGVLAVQIPINQINDIMTNNNHWEKIGLGETGESYLVGPDYKLRSMSRFFIENPNAYLQQMQKLGLPKEVIEEMALKRTSIGLQPVTTEGSRSAIQSDQTGFGVFEDYRKIPVLSAYAPLNIPGLDWAILCEIDASEAYEPAHKLAIKLVLLTALVVFIMVFASVLIGTKLAWKISKPMEEISRMIKFLSIEKDLTKRLKVDREDELGEIAKAINELFDSLQKAFQDTINSTARVEEVAAELEELSEYVKGYTREGQETDDETMGARMERVLTIEKKGTELKGLSTQMKALAQQFKIIEEKTEEMNEW